MTEIDHSRSHSEVLLISIIKNKTFVIILNQIKLFLPWLAFDFYCDIVNDCYLQSHTRILKKLLIFQKYLNVNQK